MDIEIQSEVNGNFLEKFAQALKSALDKINFPTSPERISKLMDLLSLSKPQVYRITSGKAAPTLESLVKLRELNISIDNILDELRNASGILATDDNSPDKFVNGKIEISGITQRCLLTLTPLTDYTSIIATLQNDHIWHVTSLKLGTLPPIGAMNVCSIFLENAQPRLAVVDDHCGTLTALCKQLASTFNVSPFSEGTALLKSPMANQFDGYLLDWRLPDISGEELVMSIRRFSDAPIFVVTGEKSSYEIAKVIASANVRYVVKPIDEIILTAELMHAITLHTKTENLSA